MYSKTLLTTLFLLSMSHLVAEEDQQVQQLMSDMEQIKQQISALQSTDESQDLTDQILQLAAQIQLFHLEAIRHNDEDIALVQENFTKQIEALKKDIASNHEWGGKAFEILTKTLEEIQNKYLMKDRAVAYADDQEEKSEKMMMGSESEKTMECTSPYRTMNVGVRHNEARGVGYKEGYSTLEGFFTTDDWSETYLPFLDVRGHIFNNGRLAGNAGVGMRTMLSSINHYLGAYLYYDVRNVRHLTVNQLGPGIELLSERMEYRVNGYFPVGKQKSHFTDAKFYEFEGNSLIIERKRKRALYGVDGEVGAHFLLNDSDYDLYAGATPYYLWNSHTSAFGGKLRLKGSYMQYVSLEILGTYDHLFRATVQGSVAFSYPFGPKPKRKGSSCSPAQNDDLLVARVTQSPYRFEIPMIKNQRRREAAVDPATGQPYTFWFVNNTSSSAGTFESPFPTLVQAQNASAPNDVIYVFPGTTNGMNQGITLQDNQKLFGSGTPQMLATTHGTVTIPAFTSSSPLLTNTSGAGNVVTLANNNEVSGLSFIASVSGSALVLGNSGTVGASIHNNTFTGAVNHFGINTAGSGTINVNNNQFAASGTNTLVGIRFVQDNSTFATGQISNNTVNGYAFGILIQPQVPLNDQAQSDITIAQNTISNFTAQGIQTFNGPQSLTQILNNTIYNASGSLGIFTNGASNSNSGCVIIDSNQVFVTGVGVLGIRTTSMPGSGSTINAIVKNNNVVVNSPTASGIQADASATNTLCLVLQNNTISSIAPGFGFTIAPAGSTGTINLELDTGNIGTFAPNVGTVNLVPDGTCACSE